MDECDGRPILSLVVSTIGRPTELRRLLDSIAAQEVPGGVELIVIDQSADRSCLDLLESGAWPFPVIGATSARGVSTGRNVGAGLARGWLLAFPDDNCWYAPDTVRRVLELVGPDSPADVVSGMQVTADGRPSMLRWPRSPVAVTRHNIQRTAISSTIFLKRTVFDAVGGFDESIGVGSPGPYQAGEDTDILLRALAEGFSVIYEPKIKVLQDDPRDESAAGLAEKMSGYGRGTGYLYRKHHLSTPHLWYLVARKVGAASVRTASGRRRIARADLAWARGVLAGYRSSGTS